MFIFVDVDIDEFGAKKTFGMTCKLERRKVGREKFKYICLVSTKMLRTACLGGGK